MVGDERKGDGKDMATPLVSVKDRLEELKHRAKVRKNNPNLRHKATAEELKIYNQNAIDLEVEQFKTIK